MEMQHVDSKHRILKAKGIKLKIGNNRELRKRKVKGDKNENENENDDDRRKMDDWKGELYLSNNLCPLGR